MVFGTFDILHKGHLDFFKQAKKYGDYLIVAVARDDTVKKVKGKLPCLNQKKRLSMVRNIAAVDKAVFGRKKYYYKLEEIDINQTSTFHGPVKVKLKKVYDFFI